MSCLSSIVPGTNSELKYSTGISTSLPSSSETVAVMPLKLSMVHGWVARRDADVTVTLT